MIVLVFLFIGFQAFLGPISAELGPLQPNAIFRGWDIRYTASHPSKPLLYAVDGGSFLRCIGLTNGSVLASWMVADGWVISSAVVDGAGTVYAVVSLTNPRLGRNATMVAFDSALNEVREFTVDYLRPNIQFYPDSAGLSTPLIDSRGLLYFQQPASYPPHYNVSVAVYVVDPKAGQLLNTWRVPFNFSPDTDSSQVWDIDSNDLFYFRSYINGLNFPITIHVVNTTGYLVRNFTIENNGSTDCKLWSKSVAVMAAQIALLCGSDIQLYDIHSGQRNTSFNFTSNSNSYYIYWLEYNSQGQLIVSTEDDSILLVNPKGDIIQTLSSGYALLQYSQQTLYDPETDTILALLGTHTANYPPVVRADAKDGRLTQQITYTSGLPMCGSPISLALGSDGDLWSAHFCGPPTGLYNATVRVLSSKGQLKREYSIGTTTYDSRWQMLSTSFAVDEKTGFFFLGWSTANGGIIRTFTIADGTNVWNITGLSHVTELRVVNDSRSLLEAVDLSRVVWFDINTRQQVDQLTYPKASYALSAVYAEPWLFVSERSIATDPSYNQISQYNLTSRQVVAQYLASTYTMWPILSLQITQGMQLIAICKQGASGALRWNITTTQPQQQYGDAALHVMEA